MMSLSSSQAGIVAARRNKINSTQFSSYRYVKVEYDDEFYFESSPPRAKTSFTARHIYNYNKNNNSFTFLGVQKAQSLKRDRYWISEMTFAGSDPSSLNGTYIRSSIDSNFYWKNGMVEQEPYISFVSDTSCNLYYNQGQIAANFTIINNFSFSIDEIFVTALYYPTLVYGTYVLDNTSLNNINKHRLYTNINADLSRQQLIPDVNFNINTANIFDTKNLANNQKVFVDIRWIKFVDGGRKGYAQPQQAFYMNNKKGNIYRVGIIIKDNTIDSMLYHTDLVTNSSYLNQMKRGNKFGALGI